MNGRKFRITDVVKEPKRKYLDTFLSRYSFQNSFWVQRQSVDPHMFYRVPRIDDGEPEPQPQCFNFNAEILEKAREVITINLVAGTLLMALLPSNIYNIIVYFSSIEHSDSTNRFFKIIQFPFIIIYPFLICKKLLKSINQN